MQTWEAKPQAWCAPCYAEDIAHILRLGKKSLFWKVAYGVDDDFDGTLATDCGMIVFSDYLLRSRRRLFRAYLVELLRVWILYYDDGIL